MQPIRQAPLLRHNKALATRHLIQSALSLALLSAAAACDLRHGIPADRLCAQIESASDCDTEECVTVGCYWDIGSFSHECAQDTVYDVVHVQGTLEAVGEVLLEKCHKGNLPETQLCLDTGSPADVYVACLDVKP